MNPDFTFSSTAIAPLVFVVTAQWEGPARPRPHPKGLAVSLKSTAYSSTFLCGSFGWHRLTGDGEPSGLATRMVAISELIWAGGDPAGYCP